MFNKKICGIFYKLTADSISYFSHKNIVFVSRMNLYLGTRNISLKINSNILVRVIMSILKLSQKYIYEQK